jgi:hypothetical protein
MLNRLLNALTLGGVLSGLLAATLWAFRYYSGSAPYLFAALYAVAAGNTVWVVCRISR